MDLHKSAVALLSTLRGYAETEIEDALVEGTDDYDSAIASDIASITSALRDADTLGYEQAHSDALREIDAVADMLKAEGYHERYAGACTARYAIAYLPQTRKAALRIVEGVK